MKKLLLIAAAIILQATFLFAQSTNWGPWTSISCFKGFQVSAKNMGLARSVNRYEWTMRVKNNYNKKVHFDMYWYVGSEKYLAGRFTLNPGEHTILPSSYFNSNSTSWRVEVEKVCFGENWASCSNNCYAQCDNGTPNQPDCNGNKISSNSQTNTSANSQTNTSANNSSTTQPKNDPVFDRNNASFQDLYKKAMAAKDAGNLNDAESYLNSAISVAVNDAQRDNARAWLVEVQKAKANSSYSNNNAPRQTTTYTPPQPTKTQKQAEALNQLSGLLTDFSNSLAKQKQEKREREQRERQQQLAKQQEEQNRIKNEKKAAELQQESYLRAHLGHTTINTDFKNRFNLPTNAVKKNDLNMVLINYSTTWCEPCKSQVEELMKLPDNYNYSIIQLVNSYEEFEGVSKFYNSINFKKPVYYVYQKDFETKSLNKDGNLPSIYAYWEYEPKGNIIGLAESNSIKAATQKTKDFYFPDKTVSMKNNTLDLGQLNFNEALNFKLIMPIDVKSATSSCGCIQSNLDDFNLYITFIPNFQGIFLKRIQLTTNDGKTNEITLKGTVKSGTQKLRENGYETN